ncbi:MAG: D-alanyl-D-alanine carboxypeptidase family protein [Sporichthyaceae bacterium]
MKRRRQHTSPLRRNRTFPTVRAWAGAGALAVALGTALPAGAAETPAPAATSQPPARSAIGGPRMAETGVIAAPGTAALPPIGAAAWVVADADTGQILAARDPHRSLRPASTLKTLLALTMAPRLDKDAIYTADWEDANQEGTRVGLWPGHTYRVDDLWYSLMLKSGNDAATALAKAGGGTLERGLEMMRAEARRLQANDTTVANPSGLDADGQFASAYDLALWGRAALSRGDLRHYMGSIRHNFQALSVPANSRFDNERRYVHTENRLVRANFPGAIGVKMGYTTKAQNTMIAAAERDGRTILATFMFTPGGRIATDSAALVEWGFANADRAQPVGTLVEPLGPAVVNEFDGALVAGVSAQYRDSVQSEASLSGSSPLGRQTLVWTGSALATLAAATLVVALSRRRRPVVVRV